MSAENISYDLKRFAGIKRDYTPEDVERLLIARFTESKE